MRPETSSPDPAAVRRALQMAEHLPAPEAKRLRVQVVDRHGHLLASGVLESLEQVDFLKDMLQHVGAFELVPPALATQRGCDALLREAHAAALVGEPTDLVRAGSGGHARGTWGGDAGTMGPPRTATA